jgi:hypothetical protein
MVGPNMDLSEGKFINVILKKYSIFKYLYSYLSLFHFNL